MGQGILLFLADWQKYDTNYREIDERPGKNKKYNHSILFYRVL
jgi:hypothetical protein